MFKKLFITALILVPLAACEQQPAAEELVFQESAGILREGGVRFDVSYRSGDIGGTSTYIGENGEESQISWSGWEHTVFVKARTPHILEDTDEALTFGVARRYCDELGLDWHGDDLSASFVDTTWKFEGACK